MKPIASIKASWLSRLRSLDHERNIRTNSAVVLLGLYPALAVVAPRALPLVLLAVIFMLGLTLLASPLLGMRGTVLAHWHWRDGRLPALVFFTLFIAWMLLSLLWSPRPLDGLKDIAVLACAVGSAAILARLLDGPMRVSLWLLAAIGINFMAALLLAEHLRITELRLLFEGSNRLADHNRSTAWMAGLMLVVAFAGTGRSRSRRIAVLVLPALALAFSGAQSAQLGFLLALGAAALLHYRSSMRHVVTGALAITLVAFPLVLDPLAQTAKRYDNPLFQAGSVVTRISIWQAHDAFIDEKPFLGWGAKADRYLGSMRLLGETTLERSGREVVRELNVPSPHNFLIELRVNFGLVGVALLAGAFSMLGFWRTLWRDARGPVLAAIIVYCFSHSATASSVMQSWWLMTVALLLAVASAMSRQVKTRGCDG